MKKGVLTIKSLLQNFNFEILNSDSNNLRKEITHSEINRPGLELVGYYDYTDVRRPVILGLKEIKFIESLSIEAQQKAFDFLTQPVIPYILISRGLPCPEVLLQVCKAKKFPLYRSDKVTADLINEIVSYTSEQIAPQQLCHGTLLEIFGVGVLLCGKSGIGKSESALELIKKGHRLIADDSIIAYEMHGKVYGKPPAHLKNLLEVRGIGVIDVSKIFGITSIGDYKGIDYIVQLVSPEEIKELSRLSTGNPTQTILNKEIAFMYIPVAAGRAVADLIEVGVTNLRLKSRGFDATQDLIDTFDRLTSKGEGE